MLLRCETNSTEVYKAGKRAESNEVMSSEYLALSQVKTKKAKLDDAVE